ncbi:hypothetical protein D3C87_1431580 [compost metagenome]
MGDEDDRLALIAQNLKDTEEVICFGRGQNTRRLIENEDLGAAIKRFQYFDTLLAADRQLLDHRIRIDFQTVILFEPLQFFARTCNALGEQLPAFRTEHDIFQHGEILDQHEMLVDHADSRRNRGLAVTDRDRLTLNADLTLVGVVEAIEDRHQCRLTGTVFADNAVDGSLADGKVDVLVRMDCAELLVDADKFDRGLIR